MKRKVKEFKEPETLQGWFDGRCEVAFKYGDNKFTDGDAIRIIRERDYQRIVKLAQRSKD